MNVLSTLVSISDVSLMSPQILSTSPAYFFLPNRPEEEGCVFQPTRHAFGIFPLHSLSKVWGSSIQPPNNSVEARRLPSLLLMSLGPKSPSLALKFYIFPTYWTRRLVHEYSYRFRGTAAPYYEGERHWNRTISRKVKNTKISPFLHHNTTITQRELFFEKSI